MRTALLLPIVLFSACSHEALLPAAAPSPSAPEEWVLPSIAIASHESIVVWQEEEPRELPVVTAGAYAGVAMGDLDGDQDLDLLFTRYEQHPNGVLLADGEGGFVDSGQKLGHSDSWDVALADFDADGDLDALVGNTSSSLNHECQPDVLWHNDGSGRFTDSGQVFPAICTTSWVTGDLDGDGHLDAVAVQKDGAVAHLNKGGSLQATAQRLTGTGGKHLGAALGDLDGDGDLDLALTTVGPNSVWLNDGAGSFLRASEFGDSNSFAIAVGDLDSDGDLDAVVANRTEENRVWLNDGSGRFVGSGQPLGDGYSLDVAVVDVDGDRDLDVLVANRASANRVWLNRGDSYFEDSGRRLGSAKSRHIALGR